MNESIFKASLRRFFMIVASVLGIMAAFLLVSQIGSIFDKNEGTLDIKRSLTAEIQPNAQGVRKALGKTAPVILKINIEGIIGTEALNRATVEQQLIESRESPLEESRVKAIILTINSPGGTVTDGDGIYRALKHYKEVYKVPVYAHVDGLCASGGMYIACAADKIYATQSSVIGSIGVVAPPAFNFSTLMGKIGIDAKTLIAGKGKDELNPFRPWKGDEGQNYQMLIDTFYQMFVNIITTNRKGVDKEKLMNEYGAEVFPADQSVAIGFIDGSDQSYNQTLALLAKEIGVKEDEYQVVTLSKENWFTTLFNERNAMQLFSGSITHRVEIPGMLDAKLANQFLYLYDLSNR